MTGSGPAGAEEVDRWVADTTSDDVRLAPFLTRFVIGGKLSMRELSVFVRPSMISNSLALLATRDDLDGIQRDAVEQFGREYAKLEPDDDPDDPDTWTFLQPRGRRGARRG